MRGLSATLRQVSRDARVDAALTALLAVQGVTLFAAVPLAGASPGGRLMLDLCHLVFAAICVAVLTRRRSAQAALLAALALLVAGPALGRALRSDFHLSTAAGHELIALAAFAFNAMVTMLVARHVFAPGGRVTVHRVRGAVLLYLNVAALFAIAFASVQLLDPDAFVGIAGTAVPLGRTGAAPFTYFSLTTITTTGYGDIAPVHPLARSLANLEAVFGQLFPATLLAQLVSLRLAQEREG